MASRTISRKDLLNVLNQWKVIEEEESLQINPKLKEDWFQDTFNFLICLPVGTHIWCGCWDLMQPLLETFHNYFSDNGDSSPLKLLWRRISRELRQCTQCVCQHHQAQEIYNTEFESETVSPLLSVLRTLDEERVTMLLKEINTGIAGGAYDPEKHNAEVVSVMFEVLMFPILLDDQCLVNEFQTFIETIDNSHELTLAGHQQYPGVYALLFLKSERARSIGFRLAGHMGKLRTANDLEPVQPLLKKCIGFLETEVLLSTVDTSRPRVQLERITVWLGVKALLGFLEPPAFEEGILERYPIFLSIVLNYVSDDTPEFTHAVTCLRLLFEILGCKLWLRTTFSPGVMRNTLLGQCFHTRSEKSHKEIFDLFQPFLQSLEPLQDGEHERQRRHLLYFLLHQVTHSGNFSFLMRKKATKIALLIIDRGYKMNPPCPPFECAHMWGPSLVCSLKDSSLHTSLRQPAFDLVHTIIVSDASALISLKFKNLESTYKDETASTCFLDDEDEIPFFHDIEENESSCWTSFSVQSKLTSRECKEWMCVPMLWFEILVEMGPFSLPVSFSKAVIWALSRFSVVEPGDGTDITASKWDWSSYPAEIAASFGWEVANGSDDGGDGKESKNSVKASKMCIPLMRAFKRCAAYFVIEMEQSELRKQWTWEPRMAESLILLLLDPNDRVRQVDRVVLEHVSKSRGLTSGLQFLCSSAASLSAVFLGLRYALKLVLVDSILTNFHNLQHLFFVVRKLLKEIVGSPQKPSSDPIDDSHGSKFLFEGGFLRQTLFNPSPALVSGSSSNTVDMKSWHRFCDLLSGVMWPSISKCLAEGKVFVDSKSSQMTCVRLLEVVPIIFERLQLCDLKLPFGPKTLVPGSFDFKWLHDLIDWGKSSLVVVSTHWKQCLLSLLTLFKSPCYDYPARVIGILETLISCETIEINELKEHVSSISVLSSTNTAHLVQKKNLKVKSVPFESSSFGRNAKDTNESKVIVLSDDESEKVSSPEVVVLSHSRSRPQVNADNEMLTKESESKPLRFSSSKDLEELCRLAEAAGDVIQSQKKDSDVSGNKLPPVEASSMLGGKPDSLGHSKASEGEIIAELVRENEGDSLDRALNSLGRPLPLTTMLGAVPKRQLIQLKMPMEHKVGYFHRLDGGVKRFKPPRLDDWYRPILEIDFFSIVGLSSANKDEIVATANLKEVSLSFLSPEHYVEIFRPLVLEEFKAQLSSSYTEASPLEEMCCGSISVLSVERIDDFHLIRCIPDDCESVASRGCSENDLVLLTREPLPIAAQNIHMVGKVERREKDTKSRSSVLVVRFYLQNGSSRLNKAKRLLTERSKWYISRIMSITPQLREFQALSSLNDIPILPIILNPLCCSPGYAGPAKVELGKISQPLQRKLKSSFNESQLQAITVAIGTREPRKAFELSLIQGPPGTGKTRTIVAIVSALLALGPRPTSDDVSKALGGNYPKRNSTTFTSPRSQASNSAAVARAWQDALLARQLSTDGGKGSIGHLENSMRGRVLICAQSNAAVDELVSRLSNEGLYGTDGNMYKPYLVRVGNPKTVHPSSLPFFIDTLVEQRLAEEKMNESEKNETGINSSMALRSKLEKLMDSIRFYEAQCANLRDGNTARKSFSEDGAPKDGDGQEMSEAEIGLKLNCLYAQKKAIYIDLAAAQSREKKAFEESKSLKYELRKSILKEAEVVVTTLSGCGSDIYAACTESISSNKFGKPSERSLFDAVLIDEAAQALEPATLIPLQLLKSNGTNCIMVGDPKQLPATVLSNVASKFLYECSMFERLQRAGYPVTMLAEQYRMHPEICRFPSLHFYDNKLLNGDQMTSKSAPFHENKYLGPYLFFDVVDGHEHRGKNSGAQSLYNESEANAAVELLRFLKKRYSSEFLPGRVGIITPYRSQLSLLRSRFATAFGPNATSDMEFNTIDGFQGREVDILILSTVRASEPSGKAPGTNSGSIGFVADVRRMNVALTRAKLSLWVVGNGRTLRTNSHWDALLRNTEERKLIVTVARPYDSVFRNFSSKRSSSLANLDLPSRPSKERISVRDINHDAEQAKTSMKETCSRVKHRHSGVAKHASREADGKLEKSASADFPSGTDRPDMKPLKDVKMNMAEKYLETNSINKASGSTTSKGGAPSDRCLVGSSGKCNLVDQPCSIGGSNHERYRNAGSKIHIGLEKHLGRETDGKHEKKSGACDSPSGASRPVTRPSMDVKLVVEKHRETDAGDGTSRSKTPKSGAPSEHSLVCNSSKRKLMDQPCSVEGSNHERDGNTGSRSAGDATEDLVATRKRLRDAVDALLPSALIPSKKPEPSSKAPSVKRPPSPSASSAVARPPNPKKAGPNLLTSQSQERKLNPLTSQSQERKPNAVASQSQERKPNSSMSQSQERNANPSKSQPQERKLNPSTSQSDEGKPESANLSRTPQTQNTRERSSSIIDLNEEWQYFKELMRECKWN